MTAPSARECGTSCVQRRKRAASPTGCVGTGAGSVITSASCTSYPAISPGDISTSPQHVARVSDYSLKDGHMYRKPALILPEHTKACWFAVFENKATRQYERAAVGARGSRRGNAADDARVSVAR
ncbi:hypothetical protein FGB62_603g00, partial [Gracilaria domingensis]